MRRSDTTPQSEVPLAHRNLMDGILTGTNSVVKRQDSGGNNDTGSPSNSALPMTVSATVSRPTSKLGM